MKEHSLFLDMNMLLLMLWRNRLLEINIADDHDIVILFLLVDFYNIYFIDDPDMIFILKSPMLILFLMITVDWFSDVMLLNSRFYIILKNPGHGINFCVLAISFL